MPEFRNNLHDWQREQLGVGPQYQSEQYRALSGKQGMTHYPSAREPLRIPDLINMGMTAGGNAWDRVAELGPEAMNAFPLPDYRQMPQQTVTDDQVAGMADMAEGMVNLPAGILAKVPALLGMTAYHGSPHKFDKIDLTKVGTGEGNQAKGWGFYATETPDIAEIYRKMLSNAGSYIEYDGEKLTRAGKRAITELMPNFTMKPKSIDEAIKSLENSTKYGTLLPGFENLKKLNQESIDFLRNIGEFDKNKVGYPKRGHFYELDLPDATIGKMLDWDKPLNEQPESIQALFKNNAGDFGRYEGKTGGQAYRLARADHGGAENLSKWLDSQGIPGIKYLDGTSRSAGEGTRNFVIFNENHAKVLSRNGEQIRALGGDLPMDEASRMGRARDMGFDVDNPLYHGGSSDFDEFDPKRRIYASDDPEIASIYSKIRSDEGGQRHAKFTGREVNAGPNIMPLLAKMENKLTVSDLGPDGSNGWVVDNLEKALGINADNFPVARRYRALQDEAKKQGYSVLEYTDFKDLGGDQTQYIILNPQDIRSKFAKFDPSKADSANILAGATGAALLGSMAYPQDD
jgi:hypothetical protein